MAARRFLLDARFSLFSAPGLRSRCFASDAKVGCVGIVGSSGAVGQEMLRCVQDRNFPTEKVRLFANRAAGQTVKTPKGDLVVEKFSVEAAQECDIVLMAVSGSFSKEFAHQITGGPKNTRVIDNSSAFRYDKDIPLVIPEINGDKASVQSPLVANPNCTTAIGAMALWPLHQKYGLKKVLMSTYQSASGAGAEGMQELEEGHAAYAKTGEVSKPKFFAHQLPFNVIPQIDAFQENGYTKEEMKVAWELKKIFGLPDKTTVACTAVRVPTLRAHSESITIETEKPIDPDEARELLRSSEGVKVVDDRESLAYPMPLNATGEDDVEVGRIRQSLVFGKHGLEFFVSGDQLLRGAALNAVLIAEKGVNIEANAASSTSTGEPLLHGRVPWGMHKFGGASLANAELYRNAGDILINESTSGGSNTPTAAIVSAMKGMTDKLLGVVEAALVSEAAAKEKLDAVVESQIACIDELLQGYSELSQSIIENIRSDSEDIGALLRSLSLLRVAPNSTSEFVAGIGEIWSAQVLCAYLKTQGVPTAWLNARDVLVVESSAAESGVGAKGAALDMRVEVMYGETAKRLDSWWAREAGALKGDQPPIVVVAGFVACTMDGVPTTLKRSGSDYSATIFAKLFKASQVTLWKNVDGVYSADPGAVPEATSIKDMSYDEAIELAYFGGQVIHPTAMIPLMEDDTPMYVRNAERPAFEGTLITREGRSATPSFSDKVESPVKFVTSIPNIALVNIDGGSWGSVSKLTRRAMGAMEEAGVKIVLLTQACASHSVSLAVDESEGKRAVEALQSAFELELARGKIASIVQKPGFSIISTIGDEMRGAAGTLAKIAAAVARCGISMSAVAQGSSERNVTFVVEKSKLKLAMAAVHQEFTGATQSLTSSVDDVIFSNWKQENKHLRI
jgi:aspartate-semialdehyde dehydrogenase